jgi:hypothetical protein
MSPKEAAANHMEAFLQTLRHFNQQHAYRDHALKFITSYGDYYCESKKIAKGQSEGESYCPPNCMVKLPFQPIVGVKGDTAYQSLANELAASTKETKLSLGKFYLHGLIINNGQRKKELLKVLSAAVAHIAEMSLAQFELEAYGKHNLVADFLLIHHEAFLATKTPLMSFCNNYKKTNNCGHPPESASALYELRFGRAAAYPPQNSTAATPSPTGVTPADSSTIANQLPSVEAIAAAPAGAAATTTTAASASSATASPERIIGENGTVYRKELSSVTAPANGSRSTAIPTPTPTLHGTAFSTAAQLIANSMTGPSPAINHVSQQTPASASTKEPVYMIAAPYPGGTLYQSRPYDPAETQELCDLADKASRVAKLETQRKFVCNQTVLIDSIRPKSSLGIPPPVAPGYQAKSSTPTNEQPTTTSVKPTDA